MYNFTVRPSAKKPGVLFFIHGGVWIVGNFQNHQRLLRDLVVGSGQIGVFVEYSPLPAAKYPTQLEESYAALKWVAARAGEFGADGNRIAIADAALESGHPQSWQQVIALCSPAASLRDTGPGITPDAKSIRFRNTSGYF